MRFGTGLTRFNVYNVVVSISTVLFSEPRAGVFVFARGLSVGDVPARLWINLVSSTITTAFLGIAAWRRWSRAKPSDAGRTELWLFAAVLFASAVASYAYTKDEIVSAAGAFYAVAVFWAVRDLLSRPHRAIATAAIAMALVVAGGCWSMRVIGLNYVLRAQAFSVRNDWAWIPDAMERRGTWPADPAARKYALGLRDQSLRMPTVTPWFVRRWTNRVFEGN